MFLKRLPCPDVSGFFKKRAFFLTMSGFEIRSAVFQNSADENEEKMALILNKNEKSSLFGDCFFIYK